MRNAGLVEAQAGIKIDRRNINNLRYADDTSLMAETEEELNSLLMKVKEERQKAGLKLNIQKMGWCSGTTQRDGMGREKGRGFRMGNTCTPMADSCQASKHLLNRVLLFVIPWTVVNQASLSMEFSRQEYWSGLVFPSPGDLPVPGIKSGSPALQADSSQTEL